MPSPRMFPHLAILTRQEDSTGLVEPVFGDPEEVRCFFASGLQRVDTAGGREEVSTAVAYCDPQVGQVPTGSRLEDPQSEEVFTVVRTSQWRYPGREEIESVELRLR